MVSLDQEINAMVASKIIVEKQGRRHYLRGNTYAIKSQLRDAGCRWDPDAKAWWTGKADLAKRLAATNISEAAADSPSNKQVPGTDAVVAARATYKGRMYYVAGRKVRGRTHWDDSVDSITTRDGIRTLLYYRDGSKSFWAKLAEVLIVKSYDRPKTIGELKVFADRAKRDGFDSSRHEYCYHLCPVGRFKCCPENGPCHDCQ